jgi:hypothetical protein
MKFAFRPSFGSLLRIPHFSAHQVCGAPALSFCEVLEKVTFWAIVAEC